MTYLAEQRETYPFPKTYSRLPILIGMSSSAEGWFEELCRAHGLECSRVATAERSGEQRPDFTVVGHDGMHFFAEVKEVSPNPTEVANIERLLNGQTVVTGGEPGARVRQMIAKANSQVRSIAEGETPSVLVIFNPDPFLRRHTDPYSILTAMRGLDIVPVVVPRDPRESSTFLELRSGPKKRMTRDANTSISAIVLPYRDDSGLWHADAFHNRFAASPMGKESLVGPWIRHWRIREDERDWEPVT